MPPRPAASASAAPCRAEAGRLGAVVLAPAGDIRGDRQVDRGAEQLQHQPPAVTGPLGVGLHDHPRLGPPRARRHEHPGALDLDHADPAGVLRRERVAVAERRDVPTDGPAGVEERGPSGRATISSSMVSSTSRRGGPTATVQPAHEKTPSRAMADSTALDAVWPRPQIDASRIDPAHVGQQSEVLGRRHRAWPPAGGGPPPGGRCRPGTARTGRRTRRGRTRRCAAGTAPGRPCRRAPSPRPSRAWRPRPACPRRSGAGRARRDGRSAGGSAEQHRLQSCPSGTPPARSSSSPSVVPNGHLVDTRALHSTGHAEQLGPGRALGADRRVGRPAPLEDGQHVDQRLDVVDQRGLAEQPDLDRERRLVPRLAAVALDRVEDRRLLAADVGAGAAEELDVEARRRCPSRRRRGSPGGGPRRRRARAAGGPAGTRPGGRRSPARTRWRSRRWSWPRRRRTGRPP